MFNVKCKSKDLFCKSTITPKSQKKTENTPESRIKSHKGKNHRTIAGIWFICLLGDTFSFLLAPKKKEVFLICIFYPLNGVRAHSASLCSMSFACAQDKKPNEYNIY